MSYYIKSHMLSLHMRSTPTHVLGTLVHSYQKYKNYWKADMMWWRVGTHKIEIERWTHTHTKIS